jgi:cobyric acid synthase
MGTYIHGLFHSPELRRSMLRRLAARKGRTLSLEEDAFSQSREFDKLADLVRESIDMDAVRLLTGLAD